MLAIISYFECPVVVDIGLCKPLPLNIFYWHRNTGRSVGHNYFVEKKEVLVNRQLVTVVLVHLWVWNVKHPHLSSTLPSAGLTTPSSTNCRSRARYVARLTLEITLVNGICERTHLENIHTDMCISP